eukprot:Gregarina_sp_Pseudo_9__1404@NODE_193_length_3680_cov_38_449327_g178_i0_p2_GENE_NODE_193_length_3680_cov_38_449327_g178_i0NODE_193_length_3680_cov_38_449327_g178_i0_p2_ORF_typecomplete_len264_score11_00Lactamase_B/PF00753_27/3_1e21HAGH_C/PF16123_5/2_8e11Lactamase_B_2/PF12706_7/0_00018Lactamase_B_3/PF13483_6/0_00082Lactamase_B_5/PF14597_6/0_099_NODE_193_length_3680_cov_38_449327_g178_i024443235
MSGYQLPCPQFNGQIHVVPYFNDNLGYIIVDNSTRKAALVDVVFPDKFANYVKQIGCDVEMILTTHYHSDHQGGNKKCPAFFPNVPIYKSKYEPTDGTHDVSDGDILELGSLRIKALHTPTHTRGHISYFISDTKGSRPAAACTGDFLFVGGCGRFFEGDAQTMIQSVEKIYSECGEDTYMLPGHDYGQNNLKFAATVEPENRLVGDWLHKLQSSSGFVPVKFSDELGYNPFIRCVMKFDEFEGKTESRANVLQDLRRKKDAF